MIELKHTLETRLGLILTPRIDLSLKILSMNVVQIEEQLKEIAISNPLVKIDEGIQIQKQPPPKDNTKEIDEAFKERFVQDEESVSDIIEATAGAQENLQSSLLRQLKYEIDLDETKEEIAKHIVYNLDEKGFLSVEPERIAEELKVNKELVEQIRKTITKLEPLGCGCLDNEEFILLQAEEDDENLVPLLKDFFDTARETNRMDLNKIKEKSNLKDEELEVLIEKIKGYMLYPLENYQPNPDQIYVQPDIYIKKVGGELVAVVEDRYLNQVSIDEELLEHYLKEESAKDFIKERYKQIKEFLLAVTNRNKTLLKTVQKIIERQRRFFEDGTIMPLTRKEIAKELGFNVSTITRTVANKYVEFEGRIIPLSSFFSSGLDENTSKEYVKLIIKNLIENEDKNNPLSDDQIRAYLKDKGIDITRRTVTKYRKELNIPSSRERKNGKI